MTAETDIATYLASQGFGTLGSTIFVNDRPASPDALISVFGYPGQAPERPHDTSGNAKPGVQVWVRGAVDGAGTARARIESIFAALDGITNTTINGTFYVGINGIQSGVTPMGKDEVNRPEYVWNFTCTVRR